MGMTGHVTSQCHLGMLKTDNLGSGVRISVFRVRNIRIIPGYLVYYRVMLRSARYCYGKLALRLSVRT